MTFEALLHGLVGEEVMVSVGQSDTGGGAPPVVSLSGPLRKVGSAPSQHILEQLGRAVPGDEAFMVHVGGSDDPAELNYFLLRKSAFEGAEWAQGVIGEPFLIIYLGNIDVTITRRKDAEQGVPRP